MTGPSMTDDFKGAKAIVLQPSDEAVPFKFQFTICSSASANDGAIPYGDSVSSVEVTAHTEAGADVTSELINGTPAVTSNVVTVVLDYPSITGEGTYHMKLVITTANGVVIEFDFDRVFARNK